LVDNPFPDAVAAIAIREALGARRRPSVERKLNGSGTGSARARRCVVGWRRPYRVVYQFESAGEIQVVRLDHRADIYRPWQP
jgi:ParE toxin of type II toxin-antitoxin system, parDE